ncbi:hypothetical protein OG589_22435 [Sphaerisporangium sp. NBC_01403]|uniref:hypothetical protein n=1 Tax=Sphaerisporangium sp. NBC_01403 TaxID=2903599 RepID=UPI003244699D
MVPLRYEGPAVPLRYEGPAVPLRYDGVAVPLRYDGVADTRCAARPWRRGFADVG